MPQYHFMSWMERGSFAALALLMVHISALQIQQSLLRSLLRDRLGGMARGGGIGLTVLVCTGLEATEVYFFNNKSKCVLSSEFLN